jgi:cholest-4-en-3-one 26-monooxygenase
MALADHPDQWGRLVAGAGNHDVVDHAVEEILRWATPVLHMRRTAAVDTTLAGTGIAAGDKVVMWYASSNRDEAVFADPNRFDIGRVDNLHQSFGGTGPHHCLGAYLARMEIRVLLETLLASLGERGLRLERRGEPNRVASNFVHGVLSVDMAPVYSGPTP